VIGCGKTEKSGADNFILAIFGHYEWIGALESTAQE